jgi:hypothetical protein
LHSKENSKNFPIYLGKNEEIGEIKTTEGGVVKF